MPVKTEKWEAQFHLPKGSADGNWQVVDHESAYTVAIIDPDLVFSEGEDIARLIAAAPELLEALQSLVDLIDSSTLVYNAKQLEWLRDKPSFGRAKGAIAKAEGR